MPKQQDLTDQEHGERQQKHPRQSRATPQHKIDEKTLAQTAQQVQTTPRNEKARQENQASRATKPSPQKAGGPGRTGAAEPGARGPDDPDARRDGTAKGKEGPGREDAKEAGSACSGVRGEEAAAGGVGGRDAVESRK
jgi:hypothetical protein